MTYRATLLRDPHATIDRDASSYESETAEAAIDAAYTEAQTRHGSEHIEISGNGLAATILRDGVVIGYVILRDGVVIGYVDQM